jgi:hypothetical protein
MRYRYYVSRPLITQDQRENSTALRIPAAEIEHLVTSRVRQWLLDPGGICQSTRLPDPSAQRRLIARAVEIGKNWTELPGTRQRAFLTTLIDRIAVGAHHIDIHLRPTRLAALLDVAATPLPSATDDEIQILSIPVRLRRSGRAIRMLIEGADPFATAKPDARLVKLLIRARQFNATLLDSDGVPVCRTGQAARGEPVLFHAARPPQLPRPGYHASHPRRPSAARSDLRQAAGALTSTTCLARAADRAWHCLSRTELGA